MDQVLSVSQAVGHLVVATGWLPRIAIALTLLVTCAPGLKAGDDRCSESLQSATRLLVVLATDMSVRTAKAQRFERSLSTAEWRKIGPAKPVVLGRGGLGWAWNQTDLARQGEPTKREGDGRTPAGVFRIGSAFGFSSSGVGKDYLPLKRDGSFCVDDIRSTHYNEIVPKAAVGAGVTGETMSAISLYRRGLRVNFPTNREKQGGSCIFIHVWRKPDSPTLGCVALRESDVTELQTWATEAPALIAILPQSAFDRLHRCVPEF
jgi:L,D-peptidoglycan transpeptidase YkuD (ErfK/YbiS/YcfS/YnhG family)